MASRVAAINTAGEFIDSARDKGLPTPEDAVNLRRSWASDYTVEQASIALDREDPDTALAIIQNLGDKLDWRDRLGLEERLKRADDTCDAVVGVNLAGAAIAEGTATVPYGDFLRGKGQKPVPGGQFGASRDYGGHQGVDFPAPNGMPVFGVFSTAKVTTSAKGGNIVTVTQPDGSQFKFMHLGAVYVKDGDTVTPDTRVGMVGMTGRSTGPRLHVEVWKGGTAVDPNAVIATAQQSPQRIDINNLYSQIDALTDQENWTPERRERWKTQADRVAARNARLARQDQDAAMRSALDTVDRLGDKFIYPSQIPNFARLAPDDRIRLKSIAEHNRQPKEASANGDAIVNLHQLAVLDPDKFAKTDLRNMRPSMTPSEYDEVTTLQARILAKPTSPEQVPHSQIWKSATFYGRDIGIDMSPQKNREKAETFAARRKDSMQLFSVMQNYLNNLTEGKRQPTEDEIKPSFDNAVMLKRQTDGTAIPRFRDASLPTNSVAIPQKVHDSIAARLKARGLPYDDQTVARVYMQGAR